MRWRSKRDLSPSALKGAGMSGRCTWADWKISMTLAWMRRLIYSSSRLAALWHATSATWAREDVGVRVFAAAEPLSRGYGRGFDVLEYLLPGESGHTDSRSQAAGGGGGSVNSAELGGRLLKPGAVTRDSARSLGRTVRVQVRTSWSTLPLTSVSRKSRPA